MSERKMAKIYCTSIATWWLYGPDGLRFESAFPSKGAAINECNKHAWDWIAGVLN